MPRPPLTTPQNSLRSSVKHYPIALHRLIHYPLLSGRGIIRLDSELAAACAMGTITGPQQSTRIQSPPPLYTTLSTKRPMTWRHMRGQSDHKGIDYVDHLAYLGRRGSIDTSAQGGVWKDQITETQKPPPVAIPVIPGVRISGLPGTGPSGERVEDNAIAVYWRVVQPSARAAR